MRWFKPLFLFIWLPWLPVYTAIASADDPLPSWQEGKSKQAILDFVAEVTQSGSAHYLPPADRIAVFDNDGTLWCEQPMYVQLAFALDRVKALAPQHPEWSSQEPFRSALHHDLQGLASAGEKGC